VSSGLATQLGKDAAARWAVLAAVLPALADPFPVLQPASTAAPLTASKRTASRRDSTLPIGTSSSRLMFAAVRAELCSESCAGLEEIGICGRKGTGARVGIPCKRGGARRVACPGRP
jgi:hypothetical protein